MKLVELDLENSDDYYIGEIKKDFDHFKVIQAIDHDGNLDGIALIKNGIMKEKSSKILKYYQQLDHENKVQDVFNLDQKNKEILSWQFTTIKELLKHLCTEKMMLSLTTKDQEEFTGLPTRVEGQYLFLKQWNEQQTLDSYESVFKIQDLLILSLNDVLNNLRVKWLENDNELDSELVNLYPAYSDDDLFGDVVVTGKILDENDNYYLVAELDETGQLDTIGIFNKNKIAHISHISDDLSFLTFAMNWQTNNHNFDPDNLRSKYGNLVKKLTIKDFIQNCPKDNLLTIVLDSGDNFLGQVNKVGENSFELKIVDEDRFIKPRTFNYANLLTVDVVSKESLKYQRILF